MKRIILVVIALIILLATIPGCTASQTVQTAQTAQPQAQKDTSEQKSPDLKRGGTHLYFADDDIDFYFQKLIGCGAYGGSTIGELLFAASHINEKDIKTWPKEMRTLAARVEGLAKDALTKNNTQTAKSLYQRAFLYYRACLFAERMTDPMYVQDIKKLEECFQQLARLSNPPIERILIPYNGKSLPGYFIRADASNSKKPTLIVIGGAETFVEDLYFYSAPPVAVERGYNVVLIELPGQGATPLDGLYYRFDVEVPVGMLIDYLISRPDVDSSQIVAYGISWGGYYVCRAAYDKRIAAIAASTPIPWGPRFLAEVFDPSEQTVARAINPSVSQALGSELDSVPMAMTVEKFTFATLGPDAKLGDFSRKFDAFIAEPKNITIPVLCITGLGEAEGMIQMTKDAYEQFPNPNKKLLMYDAASGADAHCQVNNLPLSLANVYDFFDSVLGRR